MYLQNNLISRIENLSRLKNLKYLQLALNNITTIENLSRCESLEKLDLTCNFIDDVRCVEALCENRFLRELHMIGNPCASYEGYRPFVAATLVQLAALDCADVERSERILAVQRLPEHRASVVEAYEARRASRAAGAPVGELTPAERERIYSEVEAQKAAKEDAQNPFKVEPRTEREVPVFKEDGSVYQCNWGKYAFRLVEEPSPAGPVVVLEVRVSRYLDTSAITIDTQPTYIRVAIKGKILQLALPVEVAPDAALAQRSKATGNLVVRMPAVTTDALAARSATAHLPKHLYAVDAAAAARAAAAAPLAPMHSAPRKTRRAREHRRCLSYSSSGDGASANANAESAPDAAQAAAARLRAPVSLAELSSLASSAPAAAAAPAAYEPLGARRLRLAGVREKPVSEGFTDDPSVPPLE